MKNTLMTLATLATLTLSACAPSAKDIKDAFGGLTPLPSDSETQKSASEGFKDWTALVGQYKLKTYEGSDVSDKWIQGAIEIDARSARDKDSKASIRMLVLPLYTVIDANSGNTVQLDLGPLETLGTYKTETVGDKTVYNYQYAGPISIEYRDVTMSLDVTVEASVVQGKKQLLIKYTAEIQNYVSKTTRQFTMSQN